MGPQESSERSGETFRPLRIFNPLVGLGGAANRLSWQRLEGLVRIAVLHVVFATTLDLLFMPIKTASVDVLPDMTCSRRSLGG
jgi:hypothetical protein